MAKARYLTVVATDCAAADEKKFNEWYDQNHIPILMKYEGVKKVTRYKVNGDAPNGGRYLAIYEFDTAASRAAQMGSPAFQEAMAEMQQSWPKGGVNIKWMGNYDPIQTFDR